MEATTDDSRYVRNLGRNLVIGIVAVFAATSGLCFVGTHDLGLAAAIAMVPTLFAGPYVALVITLVGAVAPQASVTIAPAVRLARGPSIPALPPAADAA